MITTRQKFDHQDVLRLEVEKAPTGLVNMVQNPNGEFGGFGWVTPVAGSYIRGSNNLIQFTTATSVTGNQFRTEMAAITAGQYVGARWYLNSASFTYTRARFRFFAANKSTLIANGSWNNFSAAPLECSIAATVAPAGTFFVDIEFEVGTSGGTYPMTLGYHGMSLRNVVMSKAATSAALGVTRTNMIGNPTFETNTTGWAVYSLLGDSANMSLSRVTGLVGAPDGTCALQFARSSTSGRLGVQSGLYSVTPGQDYTFSVSVRGVSGPAPLSIEIVWVDANGTYPGGSPRVAVTSSTGAWQRVQLVGTPPYNATHAIISVVYSGVAPVGTTQQIDAVMMEQGFAVDRPFIVGSLTNQFLGVIDYAFQNIIAPTHEIKISREGLNLGTLSAVIVDTSLDPATANLIRPGRRCRLLALNGTKWEPVYTGKLTDAFVTYDLEAKNPNKVSRISITAVDNTSTLANANRPQGVASIADLPYVLEGAGVQWNVNGNGNQVPSATVVSDNDNASALDQVAITRDSTSGYAWVDRHNVLQAWDASLLPSGVNLIPNPSFEVNTTGWSAFNCAAARVTTFAKDGTASLRLTSTFTAPAGGYSMFTPAGVTGMVVAAGREYRLSAWYRTALAGRQVGVSVSWYDPAGGFISSNASPWQTTPAGMSAFEEIATTVTAPPNAGRVAVSLNVNGTGTLAGDVIYFDQVSLAAAVPTIDESVYNSDIDVSFSTGDCINEVIIKNIQWDPADATKSIEVVYGPYRDEASITEWGRYSSEFTTHGLSAGQVATLGASILTKNATPGVRINSVQVPILTTADLAQSKALIDLYQLVRLANADKALNHLAFVTGIEHTITNDGWLMDLSFSKETGVASPQVTPPVQSTGTIDTHPFLSAVTYKVQLIPNATWTELNFWSPNYVHADITMTQGPENRTNFYVAKTGLYDIRFAATFGNEIGAAGMRGVRIIISGTNYAWAYGAPIPASVDYATVSTNTLRRLTAGEWIQFQTIQTSGGSVNIRPSPYTEMSIRRVGD